MLQSLTSEYLSPLIDADHSRRMNSIQADTSGVEDVLLQLGSDGYLCRDVSANVSRPPDRHSIDLGYTPQIVELPPPEVMDEIANLYFIHCHNQPYSVFHERSFKIKLSAGLIEPQVQYCVLGMATRFLPLHLFLS